MRIRLRSPKYRLDLRDSTLCILSGVLLTLGYDPFRLWFMPHVALIPLFAVLLREGRFDGKRRAFQAAYLVGMVHFTTVLYWIADLVPSASFTLRWMLWPGVFLIAAYLSLYFGVFGFLTGASRDFFGARRTLFLVPVFWAFQEWLRTHGALAFPWGVLAYGLSHSAEAIQGASTFGYLGLSYVLVIANALGWGVLRSGPANLRIFLASAWLVMVGGNWAYGNWVMENTREEADGSHTIAVVQPNIDLELKWKREYREPTFALIDSLTRAASAQGAELVIWPETSAPLFLLHAPPYLSRIAALSDSENVEIVLGFPHFEQVGGGESELYNAASLFGGPGPSPYYAKMHLLPFGELIPYSDKIKLLQKVDFGEADFTMGRNPVVFDSRAGKFGVLICFEATFSEPSLSFVRGGAEFLVNITNDGWFGGTPGPYQHGIMAVFRAVEEGKWLFRSANSGISMVVNPYGQVVKKLGENRRGLLLQTIDFERRPTFFSRHGYLTFRLTILGNLLLFIVSTLGRILRIPV